MNKINILTKQWFIQIENTDNHEKISVYDNGIVYGTARGQKLGILKHDVINKIKGILTGTLDEKGLPFNEKTINNKMNYINFFKSKGNYVKCRNDNLTLKIRDVSRKRKNIKVVGWSTTRTLLEIIFNPKNWI